MKELEELNKPSEDDLLMGFFSDIAPPEPVIRQDDLLAGFFTDISEKTINKQDVNKVEPVIELTEEEKSAKKYGFLSDSMDISSIEAQAQALPVPTSIADYKILSIKYQNQNLGAGKNQIERLMCPHYQWINLNPFTVLQLDIDATEEDIKYRYRKLSSKVSLFYYIILIFFISCYYISLSFPLYLYYKIIISFHYFYII
jgi:hypothetical protein